MFKPQQIREFIRRYRIDDGSKFRLRDHNPGDTGRLKSEDKDEAKEVLGEGVKWLAEMQQRLYAQDCWSLLLIFQAMDAAGKDGAIRHVMSGVNPQGCQVYSFKAPSGEELDHDYLWRCVKALPERGRIGIFNRSYYEEVLVARVHPEILAAQKLPPTLVGKDIWDERCKDMRNLEKYLAHNGVVVRKFFLNVSKAEQKKRFLERLNQPEKNWKFSVFDVKERAYWNDYQRAYQDMIRSTATKRAPWFVVPADNKWYTRLVVAAVIVDALMALNLQYPKIDAAKKADLKAAKAALLAE